MSLMVQQKLDFTTILVKGLASLKTTEHIGFDYYKLTPFYLGGQEIMVADEILCLIRLFKKSLVNELNILLISKVSNEKSDFYFYIKNNLFSESVFEKLLDMKPLYTHMLSFEQRWNRIGASITTFNVADEDDCCMMISFDNRARTM